MTTYVVVQPNSLTNHTESHLVCTYEAWLKAHNSGGSVDGERFSSHAEADHRCIELNRR